MTVFNSMTLHHLRKSNNKWDMFDLSGVGIFHLKLFGKPGKGLNVFNSGYIEDQDIRFREFSYFCASSSN